MQVYADQQQIEVGGPARFEVVVRNQGTADATGIVLTDNYERGLSHNATSDQSMRLQNDRFGNLRPGETRSTFLDFKVTAAGRLCHEVSVRCNEGAQASKRACVNAVQPQPQGNPDLSINKDGPRQVNLGDIVPFTVVVRNTGDVPLTNLVIVDEYDRSLTPQPRQQGYEVVGGNIQWRIDRLNPGETRRFDVECASLRPANRAGGLAKVTDDSGLMRVAEHYVEILPGQVGATPPAGGGGNTSTLRLAIEPFADTLRAGQRSTFRFFLENQAATPEEQVLLQIVFPAELTPDVNTMTNTANVRGAFMGNELRFDPISQLRPNERLEFLVPVSVKQPGVVDVAAQLTSRRVTTPVVQTRRIEILGR